MCTIEYLSILKEDRGLGDVGTCRGVPVSPNSPSRYIIVGGGAAGCVLAARLSENPDVTVTVIEAGRDIRSVAELPGPVQSLRAEGPELRDLWRYDVELFPDETRHTVQYRGRALGGSSTVNGSFFMRGVPEDYEWGPGWSFADVLPYFKRSENDWDFHDEYHGTDGPFDVTRDWAVGVGAFQQRFGDAALAYGLPDKPDLNFPFGEGIGYIPVSTYGGERTCASIAYLSDCRERPNLTIRTGVTARRVLLDSGRAVGVEVSEGDELVVYRGEEIIVCSGTFATPELLLRSGIGPADELAASGIQPLHDLPAVGRNLSCHPTVVVTVPTDQRGDDPDRPRIAVVCSSAHGIDGEHNDIALFPRVVEGRGTIAASLRQPSGTGSVRLAGPDPGALDIRYQYLEQRDRERLRDAVRTTFDVLGQVPGDELTDRWILDNLRTSHHASGTCRLGSADSPESVVDERCRVVCLDGLRVVDLSVVPVALRSGPYPTVIMLAERVADLLRTEVGAESSLGGLSSRLPQAGHAGPSI